MAEVTMIERRAKGFWMGFIVGVVFMLIAVAVFWLLGLIDLFPADTDEQNNTVVTNTIDNEDNDVDEDNDTDDENTANDTDTTTDNDTSNATNDTVDAEETSSGATSTVDGGTLTIAKDVDDSARPVDPTTSFTTDDERIYIIFDITDPDVYGDNPELMVEWFIDGNSLSDFTYELPDGQSRVYFYQNNAGVGDYKVTITADGKTVGSKTFTVTD